MNNFTNTSTNPDISPCSLNRTNMAFWYTVPYAVLVTVVIISCSASNTSQLVSVLRKDADGEKLVKMGTSFNNSMLKLIGHTFVNLEETVVHELCQKTPCTLWSNWTDCTANGTYAFGFQTRVRKCWYNSTDACAQDGPVTIETASKVCEGPCNKIPQCSRWFNWTGCKANGTSPFTFQSGVRKCWYKRTTACAQDGPVTIETVSKVCRRWCRQDYIVSKHGFCMKFHTDKILRIDAEKKCQSEGGHLMNADNKQRWIDHLDISNNKGMFHVDGRRPKAPGPWTFKTGSNPTTNGVIQWHRTHPRDITTYLCMYARTVNGKGQWWGSLCSWKMSFLCEIRMY